MELIDPKVRQGLERVVDGRCKPPHSVLFYQLSLVVGTVFNVAGQLAAEGITATLIPDLRARNGGFDIDQTTEAWLGSAVTFGNILGLLIVSLILHRFGRKKCHLISTVPVMIGWIMMILTSNISVIIVAKVIQGISSGLRIPVCSIVIGECTSPINRGIFLASINVSVSIGLFFPHLIGTFFNYKITASACLILSVISFIIIASIPDSPTGLVKSGKIDEGREAFVWFRGDEEEARNEFDTILQNIKTNDENKLGFKESLQSKEFWKPFFILFTAGTAYLSSGVYVISNYSVEIFKPILGEKFSPYLIMLAIDVLRIIVTIFGCFLARLLRRRLLTHMSVFITVAALLILSSYICLKRIFTLEIDWLAISAFSLYIYGTGTGLQGLPYILIGEIIPVKFRSITSSAAPVLITTVGFSVLLLAPYMFRSLGPDGTFFIYAIIVSGCWLFLYFTLPETKDRTLINIENSLKRKW